MDLNEPNLEVSTVVSSPNIQVTPYKTFYNQGDQFDIDAHSVNQEELLLI